MVAATTVAPLPIAEVKEAASEVAIEVASEEVAVATLAVTTKTEKMVTNLAKDLTISNRDHKDTMMKIVEAMVTNPAHHTITTTIDNKMAVTTTTQEAEVASAAVTVVATEVASVVAEVETTSVIAVALAVKANLTSVEAVTTVTMPEILNLQSLKDHATLACVAVETCA